jgi:pyruvate,water dikinase
MDGKLPFARQQLRLDELPPTRTKIYVNVGNPEQAFHLSFLPVDGVGLAREEFIITQSIGIHPMALVHPDRTDAASRDEIERRTRGYPSPTAFFVDRLAEGIARIAAAFHPRPVIVRLSDFKTNEYAGLIGGQAFEPHEENPMIGFRGASRYFHDAYRAGFALECQALKRVREEMGLTNVIVMVPFCRTVAEAERVHAEMARHGLRRGDAGLRVFVMCEIPSNVLLIDRFAEQFDGFSIGSNDLTQLVLGIDRDSEILGREFDERDAAVQQALVQAVRGAHAAGRPIGICGQAPSDYPSIAELLVRSGIDSLSLSTDVAVQTRLRVSQIERDMKGPP